MMLMYVGKLEVYAVLNGSRNERILIIGGDSFIAGQFIKNMYQRTSPSRLVTVAGRPGTRKRLL